MQATPPQLSCLTSNYSKYIQGDIPTPISPININLNNTKIARTHQQNNKNTNNALNIRANLNINASIYNNHPNNRPSNNNTTVDHNNTNKTYPFNFPLGFSTNTPSTPSPPPLSPSSHNNITNDILNISNEHILTDSIDDQAQLRRSISQYLIINKDENVKRSSIHQRTSTMQPQQTTNNNTNNNLLNTYKILSENYPFTLQNTLSNRTTLTAGHASDHAVYGGNKHNKTITSRQSSASVISSVESERGLVNKIILEELHCIKSNQQIFHENINDLHKTQNILINTIHDMSLNIVCMKNNLCVNTVSGRGAGSGIRRLTRTDTCDTPNTIIHQSSENETVIMNNDELKCTVMSPNEIENDNDNFLNENEIETMHTMFRSTMKEIDSDSNEDLNERNPFGHRQNLSDVFERNIDQFMLLLKSHEREKEKLEKEKIEFQIKCNKLQEKIKQFNTIQNKANQVERHESATAHSTKSVHTKSTKSHNEVLSPHHLTKELSSKTSFPSMDSRQFESPSYSNTSTANHPKSIKTKSLKLLSARQSNKKHNRKHESEEILIENDGFVQVNEMNESSGCDLQIGSELENEEEEEDDENEELGNISTCGRGNVHEFVTNLQKTYHENKYIMNINTNLNAANANVNATSEKPASYSQTATFMDPRDLSYRYLSSSPTVSQSMDDNGDIDIGGHHFYPPPQHKNNSYFTGNNEKINYENLKNLKPCSHSLDTGSSRHHTPISHDLSTPTTNTYVYHANAPRLIDIDNDPFGCTIDDDNDDGESLMVETINNAANELINHNTGVTSMSEEEQLEIDQSQHTVPTPMPHSHNIESLNFADHNYKVQSMKILSSPKHKKRKHRSTIPGNSSHQPLYPYTHNNDNNSRKRKRKREKNKTKTKTKTKKNKNKRKNNLNYNSQSYHAHNSPQTNTLNILINRANSANSSSILKDRRNTHGSMDTLKGSINDMILSPKSDNSSLNYYTNESNDSQDSYAYDHWKNDKLSRASNTSNSETVPPQFPAHNIINCYDEQAVQSSIPKLTVNYLSLKNNCDNSLMKQTSSRSINTIHSNREEQQQQPISIIPENQTKQILSINQKKNNKKKNPKVALKGSNSHKLKKSKTRRKYKKRHTLQNDNDTVTINNNHKLRRIRSNSPTSARWSRRDSTYKVEKRGIVTKFKKVFEK